MSDKPDQTLAIDADFALWRPRPLDRLGLVTLLTSLYFFQVWGLTMGSGVLPVEAHGAMMLASAFGILFPRFWQVLLANALVFAVAYVAHSPVASNNQTTAFFFSLVVLGAFAVSRGQDREANFERFAAAGRWLLPVMYFYGIYHKINVDFLDPAVSCAVVLYDALFRGTWLYGWPFGHWSAIYATFIIEGIAMIALFIPRLKKWGMLVGIPFHVIIGFTGYAYYKDFSTIVLVLYALFLPREAFVNGFHGLSARFGAGRVLSTGRLVLIGLVAWYLLTSGMMVDPAYAVPENRAFMPFFAVYSVAFFAFAMLCVPKDGGTSPKRGPAWLYLVPVLFFVNGLSPYLGLKTESSIAMYSNLHTEGGETNHLLHGVLPGLWTYQSDLVRPVGSNSPDFNSNIVERGYWLPRYELDRRLAIDPRLVVEVETADGPVSTGDHWPNKYLASNWFLQKFLLFKPVDFERPKVCTH